MKRRDFLLAGATVAALGAPLLRAAQADPAASPYGGYPVSYVAEFRSMPAQEGTVLKAVRALAVRLKGRQGFLGLTLKRMSGDSTMVRNYPAELKGILARQADTPDRVPVTVVNHVMVPDRDRAQVEAKVAPLLKVAQNTLRPADDPKGIGRPGNRDNRDYRKALSTEILANTEPCGALRGYLMHGVWETVWDHENSHLDARFQQAFLQLVPHVVVGPVEPFYRTMLLENRA